MMNARKLAIGGLLAAVILAVGFASTTDAGHPVQPSAYRYWVTYEVQFQHVYGPTGQTWHQGFTYTRYTDAYGRLVSDGAQQIYAWQRDMAATGWSQSWCSGDRVIAQGTW
jgi:hypothetical protein